MEASQRGSLAGHDRKIRWEPTVRVGDEVCIDRPHHAAFASNAAEEIAHKEYGQLRRRTRGPYEVKKVQTHAVVINEDRILDWGAINWVPAVHSLTPDASR